MTVSRPELAEKVLSSGAVADCAVLERPTDGATSLVVYAVPKPGADTVRTRRRVSASLLGAGATSVVLLKRVPRTDQGDPDPDALVGLPVLTPATLRAYAAKLKEEHPSTALDVELRPVDTEPDRFVPLDLDAPTPRAKPTSDASDDRSTPSPGPREAQAPREESLPVALTDCGELHLSEDDPRTVTEALLALPTAHPGAGVRVIGRDRDELLPPTVLLDRARRVLGGLRRRGLTPGTHAILQISDLAEYFPVLWACLLGGIRCVTITPPTSLAGESPELAKLADVWRRLRAPIITGTDHATTLAEAFHGSSGPSRDDIVPVADLEGHESSDDIHHAAPEDVAVFQLSSGSTDRPKIIQITHRAVIEMAVGCRARNRIRAGDVTFNWLPLDHVVPLVMFHLRDVVLGCLGVHAPTAHVAEDPLRWLDTLERYRVNHSWSPNFGYKMLGDALADAPDRIWDLSSVNSLLNAGEQCTMPVVRRFLERTSGFGLRPDAMVFSWGMAETATGIVFKFVTEERSSLSVDKDTLGGVLGFVDEGFDGDTVEFTNMGPPVPGARFRIVDDGGNVVTERVVGRLQARSGRVTPGYLDAPGTNAAAFTDDGWFETGDLAFITDGELVIAGRAKEQIVINGANFYCHDIEDVCGELPGVSNGLVAACGVPDEGTGSESLAILYVPDPSLRAEEDEVRRRISEAVAARFRLSAAYVVPLAETELPRTSSGKIQRAELVRRLVRGDFGAGPSSGEATVPACVHRPRWTPVPAVPGTAAEAPGPRLILTDTLGVAEHLPPAEGDVTVWAGDGFAELPGGYSVAPASAADWSRLRERLADTGLRWGTLVYLWSYLPAPDPEGGESSVREALALCGESLLSASRALLPLADENGAVLVTVSRQLRRVSGEERGCFPASVTSTLSAVLAAETTGLRALHVDLPGNAPADDAEALRSSLGFGDVGPEVAWRDGRPHTLALTPVAEDTTPRDALRRGGRYLVAGGTGGIGSVLLDDLARRYDARFLVVGRSAAARDEGPVRYRSVDVCDMDGLRKAVEKAETDWGQPLSGVLHFAEQAYRFRLLEEETDESWEQALRVKAWGTWNLAAIARERPECALVVFSSLLGFTPSVGFGAYSAASGLADALCDHLAAHTDTPVHSVLWGSWDDTGLNKGNPYGRAVRQKGLLTLTPREGRLFTRMVLRQPGGSYLVGLNGTAEATRHLVRSGDRLALERPVVVSEALDIDPPEITDAFGTGAEVLLTRPEEAPQPDHTPGTAVDEETLRLVEQVFRSVVSVPLERDRGFYELGIGSFQVLQVHSRLEAALGREISRTTIFEYPTINALAGHLAAGSATDK
ncbi:SDR family NAD(P)-dependent oxidoreductase [Nocardiopsis sp. NPDC049922]|uniref:SDR family NAD(P)-dependent oxidoreductase n=1 Tax=Nocardiopsis sp. NPDC049922 TaxID=3155157 RepID=UPI0033F06299